MKKILMLLGLGLLFVGQGAFAKSSGVDEINELLRGELAAVDTYDQALKKLADEPGAKELWKALDDHKDAVQKLTAEVKKLNAEPSTDAGAWGTWAQTVVGSAKVLGDEAALKALKEGEEHGLKEYKDALDKPEVPSKVKSMIRNTFIKRQQQHIANVDKLMAKK